MKTDIVSFKSITSSAAIHRLDAPVHMTEGVLTRKLIAQSPYPLLTIKDVSQRVWHAGRWRRVYVTNPEHGITLLGSSAILKADLSNEKLISIKYTQEQEDKKLQKGWTLISCSGTIGNCAFSNALHAEKLAFQPSVMRRTCVSASSLGLFLVFGTRSTRLLAQTSKTEKWH